MIEAELPDGTVLEFPDGTPPEVIQVTVKRTLGAAEVPPIPEVQKPSSMTLGQPLPGTDIVRAGLHGMTFGTSDELVGAVQSRMFGTPMAGEIELERARLEEMPASRRLPAEIGGAIISTPRCASS